MPKDSTSTSQHSQSPPPPYISSIKEERHDERIIAPMIIIREEQRLERVSGKVTCPHCGVEVMTVTKTVAGKFAYLSCIVLGFLTFCCCIPFCVDGFKDVEHKCPRCSNTIAIFERL